MKLRFTPRATRDLTAMLTTSESTALSRLNVRATIIRSLQDLVSFPRVGRAQAVEGVRKLITRKYSYRFTTRLNEVAEEIIILTIQHPAREREHEDA